MVKYSDISKKKKGKKGKKGKPTTRGKTVSNWQAMQNLTDNLNGTGKTARARRALFYEKSGISAFKESNYQRFLETGKGQPLSISFVRSAHAQIVKAFEKMLHKRYRERINQNVLEEMTKAYHHNLSKSAKKKISFAKFFKTQKELKTKITRFAKRALPYDDFLKGNANTFEQLQDLAEIQEMYNSPD